MADDENGDDEESFKKIVWEAQYVLSPACTLFEDSPLQLAFEHTYIYIEVFVNELVE